MVVEEKVSEISKNIHNNGIRDVGAPFFKKEAANSESSRKTKALTTNIESDDSVKDEANGAIQQVEQSCPVSTRKKSLFFLSEDDIWRSNPD